MRFLFPAAVLVLFPAVGSAQTKETVDAVEGRLAALRFLTGLYDPATGGFRPEPGAKPTLRATSNAVRVYGYLGADKLGAGLPDKAKTAAFVLGCHDPKTGAFKEPDGTTDVLTCAVGVMACLELGIRETEFPRTLDHVRGIAKTFEDMRVAAAVLEVLRKGTPDGLPEWAGTVVKQADAKLNPDGTAGAGDGLARETGSVLAMKARMGLKVEPTPAAWKALTTQRADGGYGAAGEKASDLPSTYRVMRALYLLKGKPAEPEKLRAFLAACRNSDGGHGTKPGEKSSADGVYYAASIGKWLDAMGK